MNEEKINLMKDALRDLLRMIAKRGKPLSPELKSKLLEVFTRIAEKISLLRQEGIQTQEGLITEEEEVPAAAQIGAHPDLPPAPHESSNVNGFKYSPETGELLVQFHGPYPQRAGSVYSYQNVPAYIYDIFSRGAVGPKTSGKNRYHRWQRGIQPSHGAALNALLKAGGFQYKRLS